MVIDTHVFLWYLTDDPKLPKPIRTALATAPEAVFVPAICMWEALILAERGQISITGLRKDKVLRKYLMESGFKEAPLTAEIALLSRTLKFQHEDPADRFIAATAHRMGLPLATSDENLRRLGWLRLAY